MIEALPLLIQPGGGTGARIANSVVSYTPVALGDIDNLSQSLTIGGTAYAPCAYLVADDIPAGTGIWPSRHDISKVASVTGSGTAPTYGNATAISNASVRYGSAKYHSSSDTTWGQITSGDAAFEAVVRIDSLGGGRMIVSSYNGSGFFFYVNANAVVVGLYESTVQKLLLTMAANNGTYTHVFVGIDASDKAYGYINGRFSTSSNVTSFTSGVGGNLSVGASPDGSGAGSSDVLSAAMWNMPTNPWPGAATNQAVMGTIAADRFATIAGLQCSKGTIYSFDRTSSAYLDRCVAEPVRTMFPASSGWPRVCQRKGATGQFEYGLLCEPQCINELLYSEDFSNAAWVLTRATIGSNAAVAPDGNTTADAIIASADSNTHCVDQDVAAAATEHIFSLWAKIGAVNWMELSVPPVSNAYAYYNLSTGVVGTVGAGANSTGIEDWGNGWYRCWIAYTGGAPAHTHRICPAEADNDDSFAGDGATASIYVWGAQHEDDGTVIPSSYIKTTTAAVTRIKDSFVRTVAGMTTGKITMSARCLLGPSHNSTQTKSIVAIDVGAATDSVEISVNASDNPNTKIVASSSTQADITGDDDITNGNWHNIMCTAQATLARQKVDGVVDGTDDTTLSVPSGCTSLRIGCKTSSNIEQPLGLIREIKLQKDVI